MDYLDRLALAHYSRLIEQRFPPHLAAAIAAANYAHRLTVEAVLDEVQADPAVRREAGRAKARLERGKKG
jgi:hypothetical protein